MRWWKIDFEAAGLFTDGEFVRLEGGTLDVGIVRAEGHDAPEHRVFDETFDDLWTRAEWVYR